jgi:deoxycytidylate deaminase
MIKRPELFLGFVAPIGANCAPVVNTFKSCLKDRDYRVIEIKVTDVFDSLKNLIPPLVPLEKAPSYKRYDSYISYGNQLRRLFGDDCLALVAVRRVMSKRIRHIKTDKFSRTAFLIHQFKREEEIDLLRAVYGSLFFQISVYSRRGARVDYLSRDFARTEKAAGPNKYRHLAEKIITRDEHEAEEPHGQRITKIFHDADFIINIDAEEKIDDQISRFCELLFSSNSVSPTRSEHGLFLAKVAALRSLDLSRQVGAALFSESGELLAFGCNEVPKALGGTYWTKETYDDRDFVRGEDSNETRKRQILGELIGSIAPNENFDDLLKRREIKESQFMDALEYGRVMHAEMCSICDAARVGHKTKGATLYCTTFPCHMCAKHIVAAGIAKVMFLEPYQKSLAYELHSDSIQIEGNDRGPYVHFPAVRFEHFNGVTPRRYREFFERGRRKSDDGRFNPYRDDGPMPLIAIPYPYYTTIEGQITTEAAEKAIEIIHTGK